MGSPVVAGGLVYLMSLYGADRTLTAYRAGTGEKVWTLPIGDQWQTHPVIVNGRLYLLTDTQLRVYAPNPAGP